MPANWRLFFSLVCVLGLVPGQAEQEDFYSSISGLENLVASEAYLVENLEVYLDKLVKTNIKIKRFLKEVERELDQALVDPVSYYENPLNDLRTMKRFAKDWKEMELLVFNSTEALTYEQNKTSLVETTIFQPMQSDLQGAARGLMRLQSVYDLDTSDVAGGELLDIKYSPDLSASDCFYMGVSLYESQEFHYAVEWFSEARSRLRQQLDGADTEYGVDLAQPTEESILEYLAPAFYNMGNAKMAAKLNEELLALNPSHEHGLNNWKLYDWSLLEERRPGSSGNFTIIEPNAKTEVEQLYEKVCREELVQTASEQRDLRCRYATNNVPFCLIAPFKVEELNLDPYVAYYHEAIYEREMEKILSIGQESVVRSKIGNSGDSKTSDIRTSKGTWLWFEKNEFMKPLGQRLVDMTGLDMSTGEALQVANYGIGGHYGPHFDFTESLEVNFEGKGNRYLTALFYINSVEAGGSTAFPFLRLAVPPIRGSMVMWYNMHESLELDFRTKHAGCPVLKGSKWICNEWFHERGQEFRRPCPLQPQGHKSITFKDLK